ncbi:MAG: UDP-3-O-(3-hydroxymyristoyl)glucosamine N-acyltransferase [candidate division Zixibacteria bacterium]|nr:UDP-3-O-(3-hydroxymyristoyl)glucosamine N-acyltransferase [candidate division Zixibacteria bacterium]
MIRFNLSEIAKAVGGEVLPPGTDLEIKGIAGIENAGPGDLTFIANRKYIQHLTNTKASAVLINKSMAKDLPIPAIAVEDSYFAFRQIMIKIHGERESLSPGIADTAIIGDNCSIADDAHIGDYVVIADGVSIGSSTYIYPHSYIAANVSIGEECLIHPRVTIMKDTEIGNRVVLHPGAVIGSDGFGFAQKGAVRHKIPQVGKVVLEDDVDIGANVTIDRATLGETRIKRGTKIDNLVQIGHNVSIGEDCAFAAQVGISGSSKVGDRVILAGQVGLAGHLEIGDDSVVAAQSGVPNDVPPKSVLFGYPARNIRLQRRIEAIISRLPEYINRLRELEKRLDRLDSDGTKHL